jgi:2-polyprenyl-3-methyl-5-hydroxy-6-metoxy-1,4-benzoquinol methylase
MPDSSPPNDAETASAPRYDFETIDLDSGSTHADVVLLTGEDHRVLELGPATGYMSRAFVERGCSVVCVELDPEMAERAAEHCERVIVGDLDTLDWDAELGDDRFDVIVAADVLEHLKDPLHVLTVLRERLTEDGYFVVSLPNIAHGSVRLALLGGHFDYREIGLLDSTHLHFFTRESIGRMLDDAELGIVVLNRHELNLDASEVPFDDDVVPAELRAELEADPDSRTYQFVVKAVPMARSGMRELQRELRQLVEQRDAARRELVEQRDAAEREIAELRGRIARVAELEQAFAELSGREGELRRALVDAHDQLLRRDAELERAQTGRVEELQAELRAAVDHAGLQISVRDDEITRLRVRLDRILQSPPVRLYSKLRVLPGFRGVAAQRTAGFAAEVEKQTRQNG